MQESRRLTKEQREERMSFLGSLFGKKEEVVAERVESTAPVSDAEPVHVTDDTFEAMVLQSNLPALVDFWAPWCGPCRMIAPIVEDLARVYDGRAVIAKVNTDENIQVASSLGIMGIPTLIIFKDGQEVDRVVGYAPRHALEEKLNRALN
jgi:thioredoxin 1